MTGTSDAAPRKPGPPPTDPGPRHPVRVSTLPSTGPTTVVALAGEIDSATTPDLRTRLAALSGDLIVELSEVSFLGVAGLVLFLELGESLRAAGGSLRLAGVPPHVARLIARTEGRHLLAAQVGAPAQG
ncbi:STAS domain-containing protein [Actinokineospora sp. NBRC 105648]|uniref:STAS domain-containing protein n=1 Tax=Actinokineospora sp. NBRC 105648 TaxID=3032206 RepID=UPI0024A37494|nr:STAS domain-containing protein [Actinokineospora sp. NBRC 105648]GLZ36960.1 hypothetical protein Acsp05_05850 [Actinokineospora sp. NBRC 105648]